MNSRRSILAAGATGALALSAGCLGFALGNEPLEFAADRAAPPASALEATGYDERESGQEVVEETIDVGVTREITASYWVGTYAKAVDLRAAVENDLEAADLEEELDEEVNDTETGEELDEEVNDTETGEELDEQVDDTETGEELDEEVDDTEAGEELDEEVDDTESGEELDEEVDDTDLDEEVDDTDLDEEVNDTELDEEVDDTELDEEVNDTDLEELDADLEALESQEAAFFATVSMPAMEVLGRSYNPLEGLDGEELIDELRGESEEDVTLSDVEPAGTTSLSILGDSRDVDVFEATTEADGQEIDLEALLTSFTHEEDLLVLFGGYPADLEAERDDLEDLFESVDHPRD